MTEAMLDIFRTLNKHRNKYNDLIISENDMRKIIVEYVLKILPKQRPTHDPVSGAHSCDAYSEGHNTCLRELFIRVTEDFLDI